MSDHTDGLPIERGDVFWLQVARASSATATGTRTTSATETESETETELETATYAHPHVVVQDDLFNRSRVHSVIVCALTSNLQKAREPGNVLLEAGEGNLPKQSVVIVSQLEAVPKSSLGPRIGRLSQSRVDQALAGLKFQQITYFGRNPKG